jgi:hypothetical protein
MKRATTGCLCISPALVSYSRFPDAFAGARWIWSSNLVFDNVVLARKNVR